MTDQTEREFWQQLIRRLRVSYRLEFIATKAGVTTRQLHNIEHDGDRPHGLTAFRLIQLDQEQIGITVPKSES